MKKEWVAALLFSFLIPSSLTAQEVNTGAPLPENNEAYLWDHPEAATVTAEEMAFTWDDFDSIKNQSVFIMARFDNGWVLMLSYFWVKGGIVNQWGIYVSASDPEGNGYFYKKKLNTRQVEFSEESLYVSDGRNVFRGNGNFYNFTIDIDDFSCNLNYLNILPPWKPGDGIDYFDEEREAFDKRAVISPWANVEGTMSIDGEEMEVSGQGFAEKQMTINSFFKLNPNTYTLRLFSTPDTPPEEKWHIGLLENYTHEDYGNDRLPRLTVGRGNEWVFSTMDYSVELSNYKSIPDVPYQYPANVHIRSEQNGYLLDGTYYSSQLFNFTDIIGELPKFFKAFVLLFMERPVYYRLLGQFYGTITYPDGSTENLHLYGPYEYIVVK